MARLEQSGAVWSRLDSPSGAAWSRLDSPRAVSIGHLDGPSGAVWSRLDGPSGAVWSRLEPTRVVLRPFQSVYVHQTTKFSENPEEIGLRMEVSSLETFNIVVPVINNFLEAN